MGRLLAVTLVLTCCTLHYYAAAQDSSADDEIQDFDPYSDRLIPGDAFLGGVEDTDVDLLGIPNREGRVRNIRSATDGQSENARPLNKSGVHSNGVLAEESPGDEALASGLPSSNTTINVTSSSSTTTSPDPVLPDKSAAEEEHNSSMSIFFVLCVLALGILLIHLMLQTHFQYLPESVVIVFLGALIGLIVNLISDQNIANWKKEESFSPTAFFLVLLPPIIFESGYNLHKGNFFQVSMHYFKL